MDIPGSEKKKQAGTGRPAEFVIAALLGTAALVLYSTTACRTVFGGDSCEFTAAACFLGVPHQPGYPLYTLIGRLIAAISTDRMFAVNLLSSLFAASGVAIFFIFLRRAYGSGLTAAAGAVLLALSGTFWSLAVAAEVYSLHMLLLVLSFSAALHAGRTRHKLSGLVFASYLAGMGVAHHQSFILALPCFLVLAKPKPAYLVPALLFFLLPATLYLYPPIRSLWDPLIDYANPETAPVFLEQLTGGNSRGRLSPFEPATWSNLKVCVLSFLPSEVGPAAAFFALVGVLSIPALPIRRFSGFGDSRVTFSMLLYLVPVLLFSSSYRIPDPEGFLVPAMMPLIALAAAGVVFARNLLKNVRASRFVYAAGAAAMLFYPAWHFPRTFFENDRSGYRFVYDYGKNLLKTLEPEAILFVPTEFHYSVLVCLTEIEGFRRDVQLVDMSGRVARHGASILRRNSADPGRPEQPHHPKPAPGKPVFDERGRGRKEVRNRMVADLIRDGRLDRPIYSFDSEFSPVNGYAFHPVGFVAKLSRSSADLRELQEIWLSYSMDGMFDGLVFKKNDNLTNIIPTLEKNYTKILSSFLDPASTLIKQGEFDGAETLLRRAARLAPSYAGLHRVRAKLETARKARGKSR